MVQELFEIKKGNEGYGILAERDAGYIDLGDERNSEVLKELNSFSKGDSEVKIVDRLKVFAVFQKFGIENANGRIYPESILKKQVEEYQKKINARTSFGELNHPESVSIDGDRLAFGITKLWWEGRTLVGEIELILSPAFVKQGIICCVGDKVANYIRLGWKIGVSSRGVGSVEKDKFSGKYIVQDDFEITCWDIVTEPSTPGSYIDANVNNLEKYFESKVKNDKKNLIENLDKFINGKTFL